MNESDITDEIRTMQARAKTITWADLETLMSETSLTHGDLEVSHARADDVLCIALLKARPDAVHLVRTYLSGEKWYA